MGQAWQKAALENPHLSRSTELQRLGYIFLEDWKEIRIHVLNMELEQRQRTQLLSVIEEAQDRIKRGLIKN
jgi:hypothetical protein